MLYKIKDKLQEMQDEIMGKVSELIELKNSIQNSNSFIENTGRLIGNMDALEIVKRKVAEIEEELSQFLENSIDGQYHYLEKLYNEEIINLQNQVHLLKKQLDDKKENSTRKPVPKNLDEEARQSYDEIVNKNNK